MTKVNFALAPAGATHYDFYKGGLYWLKHENGWIYFADSEWCHCEEHLQPEDEKEIPTLERAINVFAAGGKPDFCYMGSITINEIVQRRAERIEAGLIDKPESSGQWLPEVDSIVKIRKDIELDSRIVDFAGMDVVVTSTFFVDGKACFSFSHEWQGLGSATVNAISIKTPEQKAREEFLNKVFDLFDLSGGGCIYADEIWKLADLLTENGVVLTPLIKEQTK